MGSPGPLRSARVGGPVRDGGPPAPRAVTIDLWYTLIAFSRSGPRAYERDRRSAWVEPLVDRGLPQRTAERAVRAMEEWAFRRENAGRSVSLAEQARELGRLTGIRPPSDRVGHRIAFALASADLRWSPGLHPALASLRRRGLRLGIVSNILYEPPEAAHDLLRRLTSDLSRFDAVVVSSDGYDAKPAPGILRRAARELEVGTNELLHIGDSDQDMIAAHQAGIAFLRFTGRPRSPAVGPACPFPRVRYPSVRSWPLLAAHFDRLWAQAAAARDRVARLRRIARASPGLSEEPPARRLLPPIATPLR